MGYCPPRTRAAGWHVYVTADSAADWPVKGVPNRVVVQKPCAGAQLLTALSTLMTTRTRTEPASGRFPPIAD